MRSAFRRRGIEAWSCDIEPAEDGGPHMQCDALDVLGDGWDMLIAFPPCTHLAVSGACWFPEKRADGRQQAALAFFLALARAPIARIAIENPVGIVSSLWHEPDQVIQPWQFGEDASKATCLWLKGLPRLWPTRIIRKARYANQTASGQNRLPPSPTRARERSRTYPGIAEAMAEQWSECRDLVALAEASA